MKRKSIAEAFVDLSFYGPGLLLYLVVVVATAVMGFYYSLTDWDGLRQTIRFIGFGNFAELFKDKIFLNALKNTIVFAVSYTVLHNVFGIILAAGISRKNLFKTLIFLPVILSPVIVSFIWDYIYAPINGPLSTLARLLGYAEEIGWSGNPKLAMPLIIFTQLWYMMGLAMAIYVAGIKGISDSYYEAARIDGATGLQQFRYITVPLLAPVMTIMLVYDMITSLKVFEIIYIVTKGGPGYVTETVTLMVFREAFRGSRMAYATAASVVLFFLVLIITIVQLGLLQKREVEA